MIFSWLEFRIFIFLDSVPYHGKRIQSDLNSGGSKHASESSVFVCFVFGFVCFFVLLCFLFYFVFCFLFVSFLGGVVFFIFHSNNHTEKDSYYKYPNSERNPHLEDIKICIFLFYKVLCYSFFQKYQGELLATKNISRKKKMHVSKNVF